MSEPSDAGALLARIEALEGQVAQLRTEADALHLWVAYLAKADVLAIEFAITLFQRDDESKKHRREILDTLMTNYRRLNNIPEPGENDA